MQIVANTVSQHLSFWDSFRNNTDENSEINQIMQRVKMFSVDLWVHRFEVAADRGRQIAITLVSAYTYLTCDYMCVKSGF